MEESTPSIDGGSPFSIVDDSSRRTFIKDYKPNPNTRNQHCSFAQISISNERELSLTFPQPKSSHTDHRPCPAEPIQYTWEASSPSTNDDAASPYLPLAHAG